MKYGRLHPLFQAGCTFNFYCTICGVGSSSHSFRTVAHCKETLQVTYMTYLWQSNRWRNHIKRISNKCRQVRVEKTWHRVYQSVMKQKKYHFLALFFPRSLICCGWKQQDDYMKRWNVKKNLSTLRFAGSKTFLVK